MDLRIAKLNMFDFCVSEWLKKFNISECGAYYVYDHNRKIHICSLTASAELWLLKPYVMFSEPPSDEQREEAEFEMGRGLEIVDYMDMSSAEVLSQIPVTAIVNLPEREDDQDDKAYYKACIEHVREYVCSNDIHF